MICRRCLHLIVMNEKVRISTFADQLYDRTVRGASVHADREICAARLRPYSNTKEKYLSSGEAILRGLALKNKKGGAPMTRAVQHSG